MKNILILSIFVQSLVIAQNNASKIDDSGRIILSTYFSEKLATTIPLMAKMTLENKLSQMTTQNGLGAANYSNPRFIITANVIQLTKDITPTSPPMTALTLDVILYIADFQTQTKFASTSIQVKGADKNEQKAYVEALRTLNTSNPEIREFIEQGKIKIIEYYNTQCDFILKDAQASISQNKYEEAIFKLTRIPNVSKACYDKAIDAVGPVYKKFIERDCITKLNSAKHVFHSKPNSEGAELARQFLSTIDPEASCYKDAAALTETIRKKILKDEKRDWDFKMKKFDKSVDLEQQRIQAMKEVGVAYGNNQPKTQLIQQKRDPADWLF